MRGRCLGGQRRSVDVPGVEPHILYPVKTWQNKAQFADTAKKLIGMFEENFKRFEADVGDDVRAAAPSMSIAAE